MNSEIEPPTALKAKYPLLDSKFKVFDPDITFLMHNLRNKYK